MKRLRKPKVGDLPATGRRGIARLPVDRPRSASYGRDDTQCPIRHEPRESHAADRAAEKGEQEVELRGEEERDARLPPRVTMLAASTTCRLRGERLVSGSG